MKFITKDVSAGVRRLGYRDEKSVRITTYRLFGFRIWRTVKPR